MSKALLLLTSLAAVASANASLEVYFSNAADGYGLSNPALAFTVTGGDGFDGYNYLLADKDGSGGPSVGDVPPVQSVTTAAPGDTVYVWLKFVNEPNGRKLSRFSFECNEVVPQAMAFYKLDSTAIGTGMRWESTIEQLTGTVPEDPNDPFNGPGNVYMDALDCNGIVNRADSAGSQGLYYGAGTAATGTRVALLGAVRFAAPAGGGEATYTFGLAEIDGPTPIPYLEIVPPGDLPNTTFGSVHVLPEPAGMTLLVLAGLLPLPRRLMPRSAGP